jgi:hypothetical protein
MIFSFKIFTRWTSGKKKQSSSSPDQLNFCNDDGDQEVKDDSLRLHLKDYDQPATPIPQGREEAQADIGGNSHTSHQLYQTQRPAVCWAQRQKTTIYPSGTGATLQLAEHPDNPEALKELIIDQKRAEYKSRQSSQGFLNFSYRHLDRSLPKSRRSNGISNWVVPLDNRELNLIAGALSSKADIIDREAAAGMVSQAGASENLDDLEFGVPWPEAKQVEEDELTTTNDAADQERIAQIEAEYERPISRWSNNSSEGSESSEDQDTPCDASSASHYDSYLDAFSEHHSPAETAVLREYHVPYPPAQQVILHKGRVVNGLATETVTVSGMQTVYAHVFTPWPVSRLPPSLTRSTRRIGDGFTASIYSPVTAFPPPAVPPPTFPLPPLPCPPNPSPRVFHHYTSPAARSRLDDLGNFLSLSPSLSPADVLLYLLKLGPKVRHAAAQANPNLVLAIAEIDWSGVDAEIASRGSLTSLDIAWHVRMVQMWLLLNAGLFTWDLDNNLSTGGTCRERPSRARRRAESGYWEKLSHSPLRNHVQVSNVEEDEEQWEGQLN